jgi:hypothetical protein
MANIRNEQSKYVYFVLQYEDQTALVLDKAPKGWADDELKIVRNTKYHGITTQFTNGLKFSGEAKDYIESAYAKGGINANLYLTKYTLRKNRDYISLSFTANSVDSLAWEERYRGLADFKTKQVKDNELEVKFNSDELEEIIKSYEGDEFELNRKFSVDVDSSYSSAGEGDLTYFSQQRCFLPGRNIETVGSAVNSQNSYTYFSNNADRDWAIVVPTEFVTKGFDRHVEVSATALKRDDGLSAQALFCYNDSLNHLEETSLSINVYVNNMNLDWNVSTDHLEGFIAIQEYEFTGGDYKKIQNIDGTYGYILSGQPSFDVAQPISFSGSLDIPMGISNKTGYSVEFKIRRKDGQPHGLGLGINFHIPTDGYKITLTETSKYNDSRSNYKFSHINDIGSRLLEIMTGKTHKFYSKFLGRDKSNHPSIVTGVPPLYQDYDYAETGLAGEVAVIHGFAIRNFSEHQALYKSITTSFKNYITTLQSQFNVGLGVENSRYGQRVRVEELEYFYRDEIAIKLPLQATNISRKIDPNMFVSSASFGSEKGGDYELGIGLDEPNVKASYTIPLKKTSKKYTKVNKYRSDDVGLEQVRRNPQFLAPLEDDSSDSHIWLLDMKGGNLGEDYIYDQLHWTDVLAEEPTGITQPDSYRSWRFTPKRSLLRHGWVLRGGMEVASMMGKRISVSSGNSNINLTTRYNEESFPVSEKSSIFVRDLDRARVLPEIIKITHPLDDDLMDIILGTTSVEIGGEIEEVPNFYFKVQFINENEEFETGYIKSLSPKDNSIELYKANENVIYSGEI